MRIPLRSASAFALTAAIGVSALSLPTSLAHAQEAQQKGAMPMPSSSMDHSKMAGMKGMEGMSMTGNADYDFAINMKMHHAMALDMAKAEINDGKNADMVKMAKSIVSSQSKEIGAFDRWLAAHPKPAQDGMSMPK